LEAVTINIAGYDLIHQTERARDQIGYLPQRFSLYEEMTVMENIRFFAEVRGLEPAQWRPRCMEILQFVGLDQFTSRRAGHLSGGMKQKLGLAAALVHHPRILLLDEPTRGLDYRRKISLVKNMRIFQKRGSAVLFVTHDLEFVAENIDRVIVLNEGQVLIDGNKCTVFSQEDKIKKGGLVIPQILRLSQEMSSLRLPSCLFTVEEFCDKFMERVK